MDGAVRPEMMGDGDRTEEQAVAISMQLWRDSHPSRRQAPDPDDDESHDDFMDRCVGEMQDADQELSDNEAAERRQIAWENRAARARLKQTAGM